MYAQLTTFTLASFLLFTLSRVLLLLWQRQRIYNPLVWRSVLIGGLRIDAHLIAAFSALPWLLAPWFGNLAIAQQTNAIYLTVIWFFFVLLEVSTPQFIVEYDTRPNRLYIDYLKHPKEVLGMLWKGYKSVIISAVITLIIATLIAFYTLSHFTQALFQPAWFFALITSLISAILLFGIIRGTLRHRPINPSTVAFCGDALLNTLALNSLYNVLYAVYCIKNERSAEQAYGSMPIEEMLSIIRQSANINTKNATTSLPTLHYQQASKSQQKTKNIVLIIEESLGAQYVGNLGGTGLTPCLDSLSMDAWNFTRAYATGTRSVRGLEAVSAGFPPSISDAAIRLSGAQSRFFTLAQLLQQHGYLSRFIYGGEAHFDNMKSFFLGNGFTELHDQPTFKNPNFTGTWGVSDEDMFNKLHDLLITQKDTDSPTLSLAFSVSNHSPWEYPENRITPIGDAATVENSVRYADFALGQFFAKARQSHYWDNTLFLIVADHDARVSGKNQIPVRHFHIPAVILGGGICPRRDDRIISQIDLPVTLLSLAGINSEHPMIGHDLTLPDSGGRAMMQYGDNYGFLKNNLLTVLEPLRKPSQWQYIAPETYKSATIDQTCIDEALAHALWPNWAYKNQAHSLPYLLKQINKS